MKFNLNISLNENTIYVKFSVIYYFIHTQFISAWSVLDLEKCFKKLNTWGGNMRFKSIQTCFNLLAKINV